MLRRGGYRPHLSIEKLAICLVRAHRHHAPRAAVRRARLVPRGGPRGHRVGRCLQQENRTVSPYLSRLGPLLLALVRGLPVQNLLVQNLLVRSQREPGRAVLKSLRTRLGQATANLHRAHDPHRIVLDRTPSARLLHRPDASLHQRQAMQQRRARRPAGTFPHTRSRPQWTGARESSTREQPGESSSQQS